MQNLYYMDQTSTLDNACGARPPVLNPSDPQPHQHESQQGVFDRTTVATLCPHESQQKAHAVNDDYPQPTPRTTILRVFAHMVGCCLSSSVGGYGGWQPVAQPPPAEATHESQ